MSVSPTALFDPTKLKNSLRKGEYEAQLFETASLCLIQEIMELTLHDVKKATGKLKDKLVTKCKSPDEIQKAENLIQQLRVKYQASIDTFFKKLESTVYDIFCIPLHILLPEDELQKKQFTKQDFEDIDEEINALTSRYRKAVCLEAILRKEKKSGACLDIIDRKTIEVEENMKVMENIFHRNTQDSAILLNELDELVKMVSRVRCLHLCEDSDWDYLNRKFFLNAG